MTGVLPRQAQEAMDAARAATSRLDERRHPDDNAADVVESWDGAQAALRVLSGAVSHSGTSLISEASARGLLALEQANALAAFHAAAERCRAPAYDPAPRDLTEVRAGFTVLESVMAAPPSSGGSRSTKPPAEVTSPAPEPERVQATPTQRPRRRTLLIALAAVLVLAAGIGGWWVFRSQQGPRALERGIVAFQRGDAMTAAREFTQAVERMPNAALPHVYLARLAREQGNATTAVNELTRAIELEPDNALALREMGSHQLAMGDLEMARRFYVRALERDPTDRVAMGFLGCTLARTGRLDEAQRFFQRAGPGEWNACVGMSTAVPPAGRGASVP